MRTGGVVVASPVRLSPRILQPFLEHLGRLRGVSRILLYDDNDDPISREMIQTSGFEVMERIVGMPPAQYHRWGQTHYWTTQCFTRLATIKNAMIHEAWENDSDLFLVDSDLLLHPETVTHLKGLDAEIVSEVFWTRWSADQPYLPQVWEVHPGGFDSRQQITRLRTPGQYPVNGLGACTLIRHVNLQVCSFDPIPGLRYLGEDRPFCVRAAAQGIPLLADTCYPPLHLYREDVLGDIPLWESGRWVEDRLTPQWEREVGDWMRAAMNVMKLQGGTEEATTALIASFAKAMGANRVLELGVFRGMTTAALAQAAKEVIGVDLHVRSDAVNAVQPYANVRLIEGDANEIVPTLEGPFDLVYIDDGHQYADVKAQCEAVWEKVSPGGVVLFHDALSPEDNYGVNRYLKERFPDAIIMRTVPFPWTGVTGLGVVQKPSKDAPAYQHPAMERFPS